MYYINILVSNIVFNKVKEFYEEGKDIISLYDKQSGCINN